MRFCTLLDHKQIVTRAAQSKKNTENSIYTPTGSSAAERRFKITALANHNWIFCVIFIWAFTLSWLSEGKDKKGFLSSILPGLFSLIVAEMERSEPLNAPEGYGT